ncbi:MAG TPA: hypothetical protein VG738_14595 [Chitinophagaceae bacterium]|nr:hypothetical protein [Chitinophagaceae bacterium]
MKNIFLILLAFSTIQIVAQTNPITSINISLPASPDANTANWGTGTSLITISAVSRSAGGRVDPSVEESKILVVIKKDGAKVCGAYTSYTAPAANFGTPSKVWSGVNAAALLGKDCTLPPGDYELSVQFFASSAAAPVALSEEHTKVFTIHANDQQNYQAPQGVAPPTGMELSDADAKKPIIFRWTPVIPKPQEPVTYRLRIWQVTQGQNAGQAIKSNQPIIIKDIDNLTQAIITDNSDCAPPYLCDFVWTVQALNRDGKPIGDNNGTSQPYSYKKGGNVILYDTLNAIVLVSPENGSSVAEGKPLTFSWQLSRNTTLRPAFYKLRIVETNGKQPPVEALRTNKPFFEKDSISALSVQYPSSAPKFSENKTYVWSVQAFDKEGKPVGGKNGTSQPSSYKKGGNVILYDTLNAIVLVSPENGSSVAEGKPLTFSWQLSRNTTMRPAFYKLRIVETNGKQPPVEALRTNKPFFEKDSISALSVQYPSSAPKFSENKTYVWSVQAFNREGRLIGDKNGKLNVNHFIISRR